MKYYLSLVLLLFLGCNSSQKKDILLATTTSLVDSGLLDYILPHFTRETGIKVKPLAVGTGQALALGKKKGVDILITHAPKKEEIFLKKRPGIKKFPLMYNNFIIVGPSSDPAKIKELKEVKLVFKRIAQKKINFVSRGDNSGTYYKELSIWRRAGISPGGNWYIKTGQGMGATLRIANEKNAYTLVDFATFMTTSSITLVPLFTNSSLLFNPYSIIEIRPRARILTRFLLAPQTQKMIALFGKKRYKKSLFIPWSQRPKTLTCSH
jgi:tungstate transport system substrate-binding protein